MRLARVVSRADRFASHVGIVISARDRFVTRVAIVSIGAIEKAAGSTETVSRTKALSCAPEKSAPRAQPNVSHAKTSATGTIEEPEDAMQSIPTPIGSLTTPEIVVTAREVVPTAPKVVPTAPKLVPTAPKVVPTAPKVVPTAPEIASPAHATSRLPTLAHPNARARRLAHAFAPDLRMDTVEGAKRRRWSPANAFVHPNTQKEIAMTTTLSTINIATQKTTIEAEYKTLINGLNTTLPSVDSFVINGTTWSRADLLTRLQSRIDAAEATKAARTTLHNAVNSEQELNAQIAPLRAGIKTYLQSRFGKTSGQLQLFGFAQTKATQKSAQSKANAVVKSKATRKARGTLGKKQKSTIKGTVSTPVTSTPVPAEAVGSTDSTAKPAVASTAISGVSHA
jgi:hypothetical protein